LYGSGPKLPNLQQSNGSLNKRLSSQDVIQQYSVISSQQVDMQEVQLRAQTQNKFSNMDQGSQSPIETLQNVGHLQIQITSGLQPMTEQSFEA